MANTSNSPDQGLLNSLWTYVAGPAGGNVRAPRRLPARRGGKKKIPPGKLPADTSSVNGVLLCLWDNIFGPRVEQIWEGEQPLGDGVVNYSIKHALCGEIGSGGDTGEEGEGEQQPMTKIHLFPDLESLVTISIFSAPYAGNVTKFGLCVIFPMAGLDRYLAMHMVVEDRLSLLIPRLCVLLENTPDTALELFSQQLDPFVRNIDSIYVSGIPKIKFSDTAFYDATFKEFLACVITSHMQTMGSTVVAGSNAEEVNKMVSTLSFFLSPEQRKRCSFVVEGRSYVPDLVLQGLIGCPITDEEVIQTLLPTTIVDIDRMQVKKTHAYHVHSVLRREYMSLAVKRLVCEDAEKQLWSSRYGLFQAVGSPAPIVVEFLNEMAKLPPSLRQMYLENFTRVLTRRAVVLIKYVGARLDQSELLQTSTIKRMRGDLELASDLDFELLLAIAERYSPGTYVKVAGDPAIIEEVFLELFESF
eukprot:TRINITY_DN3832_c0_g1_i1.p1 TRINITY_DN3832_c0_g1~~TRINITY_DN3832_c0_g1_i1.p1  ORF type:complete len:535 (-),score=109.93 TRINITY_DN3832_c0_g1_i1:767-2185(-)